MGNKHFNCKKIEHEAIIPGEKGITKREIMATWLRTGIALTDVYEIMETLGQGRMGEVYKVRRKKENELHNKVTREKYSQRDVEDGLDQSDRSVSSFSSLSFKNRKQKKKQKQMDEETLKKLAKNTDGKETIQKPKSTIKLKPILKNKRNPKDEEERQLPDLTMEIGSEENVEITEKSEDGGSLQDPNQHKKPRHRLHFSEDPSTASENDNVTIDGGLSEGGVSEVVNDGENGLAPGNGRVKKDKRWVPPRTIRFQRLYACKTITAEKIKKGELQELLNEIYMMRKMDHPYIIRLYEVYQVKRKLWLVMDLCTGGNLESKKLKEPQVAVVGEQILRGISYLHLRGICHRDLKMENILYENGSVTSPIRIIDFGLSQTYKIGSSKKVGLGAAYCMSPEIASGTAPYTEKSDVWSIGVIIWKLLAGDYPFLKDDEDLKDENMKNKLVNANYQFGITWRGRGITEFAKTFVRGCLKKDPSERWSANEALVYLQDQWIPGLEEKSKKDAELEAKRISALPTRTTTNKNPAVKMKEKPSVLDNAISSKSRKGHNIFDHDIIEDIMRFTDYGLLKKTALIALANTMDRRDAGMLSEVFLLVDTEHTGTISPDELKGAFKKLDIPEMNDELMEKIFAGIDHDKSGQIHYAEFLAALAEGAGLVTKARVDDAFDRIDNAGKGYISNGDLKNILGENYSEEIADKMIKEGDFKKNGRVDRDEFVQLMLADPDEPVLKSSMFNSFDEEGFKGLNNVQC